MNCQHWERRAETTAKRCKFNGGYWRGTWSQCRDWKAAARRTETSEPT